jgi:hypothetical protein
LVISPQEAEVTMPADRFASWKDQVEAGLAKLQSKMAKLMPFSSDYGGKADDDFAAITFETIDTTFEIPNPKKLVHRKEVEKIVKLLRKVMATGDETLDSEVVQWEEWKGSIVLLISAPQANMNVLFSKLLSVKHGDGLALSDHMPQGNAGVGRRYRVTAMDPVFLWTIKDPATNAALQTVLNAELAAHNTDGAWFDIEPIDDAAAAASAGVAPPRTAIRCLGKYRAAHSSPKVAELKKLLTVSHACDTIALVDDGLLVAKVATMSPNAPGKALGQSLNGPDRERSRRSGSSGGKWKWSFANGGGGVRAAVHAAVEKEVAALTPASVAVGRTVTINGVTSRPELNGTKATVVSREASLETGLRWVVQPALKGADPIALKETALKVTGKPKTGVGVQVSMKEIVACIDSAIPQSGAGVDSMTAKAAAINADPDNAAKGLHAYIMSKRRGGEVVVKLASVKNNVAVTSYSLSM